MNQTSLQTKPQEVTFYNLNQQLNIPTADGKIPLHKDKEAARAYFLEHVNPNTYFFHSLEEKLDFLVENNYIEEDMLLNFKVNEEVTDLEEEEEADTLDYDFDFIKALFKKAYAKKFRFNSFMGAYKFYTQYAMTTDNGKTYLERYEDRVVFNALFLSQGDKELAENIVEEIMEHRFQPATPTFLNAGKKRRGELVSCFLLQFSDDMNAIGRGINSVLQLSRMGGGVGGA